MCQHCDVLTELLTEIFGNQVAKMIMKKANVQLHDMQPLDTESRLEIIPVAW
jgi:hypothetical protein